MTTPVNFHNTEQYRAVIRTIQVLNVFDRIQISLIHNIPFGSVSRIVSELKNEGYISSCGTKTAYFSNELRRNPEFRGKRLNYGSNDNKTSECLQKTDEWPEFLQRWDSFLSKGRPTKTVKLRKPAKKKSWLKQPYKQPFDMKTLKGIAKLLKPPSMD